MSWRRLRVMTAGGAAMRTFCETVIVGGGGCQSAFGGGFLGSGESVGVRRLEIFAAVCAAFARRFGADRHLFCPLRIQ